MIVRIGAAPRRSGLSTARFLAHWRTDHARAASQLPGLRSYVQYHPVLVDGVHVLGYPGFDACSELDFASEAAMDEAFASPAYRDDVAADERVLIDRSRLTLVLAEREVLAGVRGDGGGARVLTFHRRHPAVAADELFAAITGSFAAAVATSTTGHELLRPLAHARTGRESWSFDAVDELVFASEGDAVRWLRSPDATRADLTLAGLTAGSTRLVAVGEPIVRP